jgi:hypothetical protein
MEDVKITKEEAFLAMYAFLEKYYALTSSDDVGGLLGSLSMLPDGNSADPAVREDWEESIEKVLAGKVDASSQITST